MRGAKYRRISDDREGRELGVTRQSEDLDALAERSKLTIVADFCDNDISASTRSRKKRPEYERMLAAAAAGEFEVILAYTSSRLTRRPSELEGQIRLAEEYGTRFMYVASPAFDLNTSAGRRVARILAANDAGEAEDIGERVKRQKAQAAEAGVWRGGRRPYGYDSDGVTVRPAEAAIVVEMAEQLLAGVSLAGIARDMNERGARTSMGMQWNNVTVRQLLVRPRNAGIVEHRGQILPGVEAQWPAILDEETFRAVCAVVEDPARMTNKLTPARKHLLTRIALCGVCQRPVETKSGRNGLPRAYRCPYHVSRRIDMVDATVERHMVHRLSLPDAVDLVENDAEDVGALHAEATLLRQRLDGLAEAFAGGSIDASQMAAGSRTLRERMDEVNAAIVDASRHSMLAGLVGVDDVETRWHVDLPLDRKRRIIASLAEVVILPVLSKGRPVGWRCERDGPYFDPSRIQVTFRDLVGAS